MMTTDDIQSERDRAAEQLMSDERILGALPDDAARVLLDWALSQLDAAAADAPDADAFATAASAVRKEARAIADAAAADGDDAATLTHRLEAIRLATPSGGAGPAVAVDQRLATQDRPQTEPPVSASTIPGGSAPAEDTERPATDESTTSAARHTAADESPRTVEPPEVDHLVEPAAAVGGAIPTGAPASSDVTAGAGEGFPRERREGARQRRPRSAVRRLIRRLRRVFGGGEGA